MGLSVKKMTCNIIYKTLAEKSGFESGKLHYYLSLFMMFLLPEYFRYLPPFMVLWGILFIIDFKNKISRIKESPAKTRVLLFLFLIMFFWSVIGLLYSENISEGIRNITLRLPLLLFPLVLISPEELIQEKIYKLLRLFTISTFLYVIVCFGVATYRSFSIIDGNWQYNPHPMQYPWLSYFYGTYFAIFQHPSYLSMYVLLSFFIALEYVFNPLLPIFKKFLWIIGCSILLLSLYLLSSRAALIAAAVSIPVYFMVKLTQGHKKQIWWAISILIIGGLFFILFSNPRLQLILESDTKEELISKTLKESRFGIWKAGLHIIQQSPVFGVGTGDIQNKLNEEYQITGDKDLLQVKALNAHNQFIEIAAENGIIALLIFISILFLMTEIAISSKNTLYLMFIIIVLISFMFETMLNRLAGLSFFGIFSFLLLHLKQNSES